MYGTTWIYQNVQIYVYVFVKLPSLSPTCGLLALRAYWKLNKSEMIYNTSYNGMSQDEVRRTDAG